MIKLREILLEPNVRNIDVDDEKLLEVHGENVLRKKLLQSSFNTFYSIMGNWCDKYFNVNGLEVELGSGAGFFKKSRPGVITSDVRQHNAIDRVIDATKMELEDSSVRCLYMINVFHHLPAPNLFFEEIQRVLKPGGGVILIEPHNGFLSALIHKRLHEAEYFDPDMAGWNTAANGPLSGANQALMHIIFERDKEIFLKKYGKNLEIVTTAYIPNALRYLLSGGVNFRAFAPGFMDKPLQMFEKALMPVASHWTLHKGIVIRRK